MSKWTGDKFILYDKEQCPFCWKIRLACAELELPMQIMDYSLPENERVWKALTSSRTVPVFKHNELLITESSVIMEYLCDLSQSLLPSKIDERVKVRVLHRYSDMTLGSGLREVIFEKRGKPEQQWDLQRIQQGLDKFYQDLAFLEKNLNGQNLFTEEYSIADCAITARLGLAEKYNVPIPAHFPRLQKWFAAMKKRPSYGKTKPKEPN